ncbi:MAG: alpha/beta fold hydrolase [Actinomycetota bacterium]|jgi:dienelactone hydrolase|nr:alpha/beta fold hydrolase [Actinomycetota bacterium]MDA8313607.1 alpha/beta fold hydrolase [Actinomycetota bacterium]
MSPTPSEISLAVLEMARGGRFGEIRELFAPQLRPMVVPEALRVAWEHELEQQGPVRSVGETVPEPVGAGMVVVKVPILCEHGALTVVVSVTEAGQLTGMQLAPPEAAEPTAQWESPAYADPTAFDEQDVTVGSGSLAVPGTLSLPRLPGPHPAVVLLGGSGPLDREETIGRNKPFKDLAWGLATRGVAVLRFDKVTFAHPAEVKQAVGFTLVDEYVPHTAAAINQLRHHPRVDAERAFLLGHSLGGTVAPRVAAAEPSVAGLVILAGGAQPLQWAMVRQARYLASLDPETAAASEPGIEALAEQVRRVDSPALSPSTPSAELPFGVPAGYWLDLRAYDPVAASLDRPILVLQGGRDYQVSVEDDLERWEAGLAGRPDVTMHVYPSDNHLFFPGSGPSSPPEYESAQHMDPAVVADVAQWLTASTGPALGAAS